MKMVELVNLARDLNHVIKFLSYFEEHYEEVPGCD